MRQHKKLKDFHAVILDFPAGTPEYLISYIGCDERAYVVDYGDRASFTSIENIALLVAKKKIDGDNYLVFNKLFGLDTKEEAQRILSHLRIGIDNAVERLETGSVREAKNIVRNTNIRLGDLGLERLAFNEQGIFLSERGDLKRYSNEGMPYMIAERGTIKKRRAEGKILYRDSNGYRNQILILAASMVDSHLKRISEKRAATAYDTVATLVAKTSHANLAAIPAAVFTETAGGSI